MAFNFFVRKINVPEVVEPPKKKENLINADLLLMKIELLHENYFHVAKTRSGKGEPRGYCRALIYKRSDPCGCRGCRYRI